MKRTAALFTLLLLLVACGGDNSPAPETPSNTPPTVTLSATPTSGPAPLAVQFVASAADADGDTLSYQWQVEGQSFAGSAVQGYTFNQAGNYPVNVSVTDGRGGTANGSITVTVNEADGTPPPEEPTPPSPPPGEPPAPPGEPEPPPQEPSRGVEINASSTRGRAPWTIRFIAEPTGFSGPVSYEWSHPNCLWPVDSSAGDVQVLLCHFQHEGSYSVSVTTTDAAEQSATKSVQVQISAAPDTPYGGTWLWRTNDGRGGSLSLGNFSGSLEDWFYLEGETDSGIPIVFNKQVQDHAEDYILIFDNESCDAQFDLIGGKQALRCGGSDSLILTRR